MPAARKRTTCFFILTVPLVVLLGGCHSAFVTAHVVNASNATVTQVELDYPSASFGKDVLGPGATYDYRFKILGSGPTKLTWTDATGHERSAKGPAFSEGAEGSFDIGIDGAGAHFDYKPRSRTN